MISPLQWFTFPLGDDMEQINCFAFYNLGQTLKDCFNAARLPVKMWSVSAANAREMVDAMLRGDVKFKFDESRGAASDLRANIDEIVRMHESNGEISLNDALIARFNQAFWRFNEALQLELGRAPIFFVTPKGVYDTRRLISEADAVFNEFKDRLPREALEDTKQAGRCLAFSLATAAGFHIARAVESVIKEYMTAYNCTPVKDSQRNWGNYIKALETTSADKRVLHHLGQLKDLHRNPMTHPDQTLTMPEAQSLWSMGVSVIQVMVAEIESKKADPSPVIAGMLPPAMT